MKYIRQSTYNFISSPIPINSTESDYLYTDSSKILKAGKGLFTAIKIYKSEIIAVFKGQILSEADAKLKADLKRDAYFINMPDGTIMDCINSKCLAKYANDAEGILKSKYKNNAVITLSDENQVCLVALHNIQSGAEIFVDYGKRYWANFKKQQ